MKNRSSPALKAVDFTVEKISDNEEYYGFEVDGDHLYLLDNGLIMSNSGKSVAEQSIVGHVSRYSDNYQLVGVDCKRVEFNLLRGVSNFAHSY